MKTPIVTDVQVRLQSGQETAVLQWNAEGARFHAWFDLPTMKFQAGAFCGRGKEIAIYKNPPVGAEGAADFRTRYLEGAKGPGAAMLEAAMYQVNRDGLIAKARQALADEEEAKYRERVADARQAAIRLAAPDLFAAVQALLETRSFFDLAVNGHLLDEATRAVLVDEFVKAIPDLYDVAQKAMAKALLAREVSR